MAAIDIFVVYVALAGLVAGFFMPFIARRFSKFMPADPASAFMMVFHFPCVHHGINKAHLKKAVVLRKKLLAQCGVFAFVCAVTLSAVAVLFSASAMVWNFMLVLVLLQLAAIDIRFHLLPDVLTTPLLVSGFLMACLVPGYSPQASAVGAAFGYLLPFIAGVVMHKWRPRAMGGGDYKMLAALGAWLGVIGLNVALVVAVVVFIATSLVLKKRAGPFGPALAAGAIFATLFPAAGFVLELFLAGGTMP